MVEFLMTSAVAHALLLAVPAFVAWIVRRAGCPGWAVVGGAIAGALMGPTILGRAAPDTFERFFVGGTEARVARDAIVRRQHRDRLAAVAGGFDLDQLARLDADRASERASAEADVRRARWVFERPLRSYTAAVAVLVLLAAGPLSLRRGEGRPDAVAPLSIGLWAAALPGALGATATFWWWDHSPGAALLAGAAVAIGPWVLGAVDRAAADEAEIGGAHRLQSAGRVASLAALAAIVASVALLVRSTADDDAPHNPLWLGALAALPIGWLIRWHPRGAFLRRAIEGLFVPSLAATAALRIDLFEHFSLWPILVMVILAGDARWLGAFIGAIAPGGRAPVRTMRLVLGSMACGPTQLAVAAVAAHAGVLPPTTVYGLLLGAIVIEVTAPARRAMSERLAAADG